MSDKAISSQDLRQLAHHKHVMTALYDRINNYHKRPLHEGQIKLARAYFNEGKRIIQSQWGRNGGKSEAVLYIATARALLYPGSQIYIICPERKQGKEIYWSSGRLPNYSPPEFVAQLKDSELRQIFKNGSFICIDGCENARAHRGVKPHLVFYDEFQEHNREFDLEIMRPNLLAKQSSLIITGTPPRSDCYYVEFKKQLLLEIANGDTTRLYLQFPTSINPAVDSSELQKTVDALLRSDNSAIVKREYLGEDCFGGEGVVFPFWSRKRHQMAHSVVLSYLEKDKRRLKWVAFADPGTTTCFAVLFVAYNPYTAQIFLVDEIYETDRKNTEPLRMWQRIKAKQKEIYDGAWIDGYDSAEAWWKELIQQNFGASLVGSAKTARAIEDDVAIIKSMMAADSCLFVSERCQKFVWEVENFVTDHYGNFIKERDHLLDCFRYVLRHVNYRFVESAISEQRTSRTNGAAFTSNVFRSRDWTEALVDSTYHAEPWDTTFH